MEVFTLGDEVLRKTAATVPDVDRTVTELIDAMLDTMHRDHGVGLAAPQVGVLKRLFVCHLSDDAPRVFINPEIIQTSNELSVYEEGCLSVPGMYADVKRPRDIIVQSWDRRGKPMTLEATGLLARVIQHEMDHLRGTLFIDHLPEKKRERLIKTYHKKLRA
jgi:peptide deformylase